MTKRLKKTRPSDSCLSFPTGGKFVHNISGERQFDRMRNGREKQQKATYIPVQKEKRRARKLISYIPLCPGFFEVAGVSLETRPPVSTSTSRLELAGVSLGTRPPASNSTTYLEVSGVSLRLDWARSVMKERRQRVS